ncbi:uncharacterized protein LOC111431174 [Cucurbita moschata]|uniref:Uncharacterized protein LOC111431174 n=1 Tax=Cucurbita moschata TaxID=3662 RepID=A0A6J1E6Z2_CUCMO|nr:uncharacterized protein LOC111431174 [Cucurbita moschata]
MNQVAVQRNVFSVREEMTRAADTDRRERLVCPKPRRLGLINTTVNDNPFRHRFDSVAANDALDLLFFKGGCDLENFNSSSTQLASSPPYLCGTPPSRVANPLIQDARFGNEKPKMLPVFSPEVAPPPYSPPPSTDRNGGWVRPNFGNIPAVRIEGFDCRLDRERRNRSIPALA